MKTVVHRMSTEILAEATRLESGWRSDSSGSPEVTSRDIDDATAFIRRAPSQKRTTKAKVCDGVAFAAAFVGGVFGNNIDSAVGSVGFAVCALVGFAAYMNRDST